MTQTLTDNGARPGPGLHRVEIDIPASHAAFEGHFPGRPVLPGVVLIDLVVDAVSRQMAAATMTPTTRLPPFTLRVARFHAMVTPGSQLTIEFEPRDPTPFTVLRGDERMASGTFDGLWTGDAPGTPAGRGTTGQSPMP